MKALYKLIEDQKLMTTLSIMLLLNKKIKYKNSSIVYFENEEVGLVILQLLASVRSSTGTLIAISKLGDMSAKDSLVIARGIIEGCINLSYIMAGGQAVAKAAIDHSLVKGYLRTNRTVGKGNHKIHLKRFPQIMPNDNLRETLEQFTSKKGKPKNWTDLSVPSRIEKIEERFGSKCATGFSASYLTIYSDASEIIHGSLAGSQIGNGTISFSKGAEPHHDSKRNQDYLIESALVSTFLSIHCSLRAFSDYSKFKLLKDELDVQDKAFESYIRN